MSQPSTEDPAGGTINLLQGICNIDYDYKKQKRQHVFRLYTSNKAEYLLQVLISLFVTFMTL